MICRASALALVRKQGAIVQAHTSRELNQNCGEGIVDVYETGVFVRTEANAGRLQTQH
jgi:hypothetical protein